MTPKITEKSIRIFMMDRPELNPLLSGVRFDTVDMEEAIVNVIDYFNMLPPPVVSYTVETFPFRMLLLLGVSGHLLRGASINEASNNLSYAVDGVTVNDKDKASTFLQMGNSFWEEFKQLAQQIKISQNVAAAWGNAASEYSVYPTTI